jgi:hypothetical protein
VAAKPPGWEEPGDGRGRTAASGGKARSGAPWEARGARQ